MADDNEAKVKITADATGVQPGVDTAKEDLSGLAPYLQQLNAQFAELAATIKESMATSTAEVAEMAEEMKILEEETEQEALSLKELALMAKEGAEGIEGMKAAAAEFAEVFIAAFAIEEIADWAKEFAEAAEHVEHLAQTFGMTTTQIQQLNAVAITTGISLDTITRGMQVLDKNAVQAAEGNSAVATAFKAVGIAANDGSTQWQRLMTIADKFKEMDDGPKKVALAMELLGRSGAQLIPVLNMGSEGLEQIAAKAKEYDVAQTEVSASAQERGAALAESINEGKLAWQGLTNILGDAFAPTLKEIVDSIDGLIAAMIESYNEGGIVATVFEVIKITVEEVGAVINGLAAIFSELWSVVSEVLGEIASTVADLFGVTIPGSVTRGDVALNIFKDTITVLKDAVIVACEIIRGSLMVLIDYVRMFANAAHDALTLQWDKIDNDWKVGCDRMAKDVEDAAKRIQNAMSEAGAAISAAMHGEALPAGEGGIKEGEGAGGDFNPKLGAEPKEKKPKDDLVQRLQEELTEKKLAWSMEQDAQDGAQQYSLASEAEFWKDALSRQDLTVKDRLAIEQNYLQAHGELVKQDIEKVVDGFKGQLAAYKNNADQQMDIATKEADFIKQKYGAESTEYAQAQAQIAAIAERVSSQRIALAKETSDEINRIANDGIAAQESAAKFRVQMGVETDAQMLQQERLFEAQRFQIQEQALLQQKSLVDPLHDPLKFRQVCDQIQDLERQHQQRLTQIDQQSALQRTMIERNAITQTGSVWGQQISKMLTLQQGFMTTVRGLYTGMVDVVASALEKIIEKWVEQQLAALLLKRTTQSADGIASVTSNAAVAASAAYAATAAIPIVGPELAPAAAATAMAGAMSFAPMASASRGWGEVPFDGAITELHKEEMVLPANLATPLRSMLTGGGLPATANMPSAIAGPGGDFHYHDHSGRLTDADIMAKRSIFAKAWRQAHREGAFTKFLSSPSGRNGL